jgi:PIN domain nuclease of toxin-antitoxin system
MARAACFKRLLLSTAYGLSAISAWEIAVLVQQGLLMLPIQVREWVARNNALSGLHSLPVAPRSACAP